MKLSKYKDYYGWSYSISWNWFGEIKTIDIAKDYGNTYILITFNYDGINDYKYLHITRYLCLSWKDQ